MDDLILVVFNYVKAVGSAASPLLFAALVWQTRELIKERMARETDRTQAAIEANARIKANEQTVAVLGEMRGILSGILARGIAK